MTETQVKTNSNLLPFPVIASASSGDTYAINVVLKHYAGYIAALSMRTLYDEQCNPHLCIDDDLRRRLETKLITNITKFRLD